jgi:mannose-1-phosphate guanylyltransferase
MKAMILAAGLGTRLRPLTDNRPKALVEVAGRTLLEITLRRLKSFGIFHVIINVHHFADLVFDFLQKHSNFGMHIEISREDVLLDTGGGLKKAAWFFLNEAQPEAFLLHNVDVISTIDLAKMIRHHEQNQALATLAVQNRETSRYLLFDENNELCGRQAGRDGTADMVRAAREVQVKAFAGIHVVSPRFLRGMSEDGVFSIITSYLRAAASGGKILAFGADAYYWRDLGTPENVAQAEIDFRKKLVAF